MIKFNELPKAIQKEVKEILINNDECYIIYENDKFKVITDNSILKMSYGRSPFLKGIYNRLNILEN